MKIIVKLQVFLFHLFLFIKSIFKSLIINNPSLNRNGYYRNIYLKSDAWKRKRFVVLKRDNWTCRYCGSKATQVHHLKYAKKNIGKEPIDWLVSICEPCYVKIHK